MSHTDSITLAPVTATTETAVLVTPNLAANIAQAQADGDLAYSLLAHAGYSEPELADAYHYEYTATMRRLGTPMPCGCDHCRMWKGL
jgi:hypothetical protein